MKDNKNRVLFQFTPLREGRRRCWEKEPTREEFQFTPLREGRQHLKKFFCVLSYFNSRPSARGDQRQLSAALQPY